MRSNEPDATDGDIVSDGMTLLANSVQEPFSVALGLILMKGAPLLFCVGWIASFLWRRVQLKELFVVTLAFGLATLWAMRFKGF